MNRLIKDDSAVENSEHEKQEQSFFEKLLYNENEFNEPSNDFQRNETYFNNTVGSNSVIAIFIKIISLLILISGCCFGAVSIYTSDQNMFSGITFIGAVYIMIGSSLLSLFFFALGEIINLLHEIKQNTE